MKWDNTYRIAVDFIDDQHKEWFAKIAAFEAAIDQGEATSELARTLKFIVEYSQEHLNDEETYMREIGFPHLEKQMRYHKVFMQHIVGVLTDMKNGKEIRPAKLLNFMVTWIRQHILTQDRQIGEFVTAQLTQNEAGETSPAQDPTGKLIDKLKELAQLIKSDLITDQDLTAKKEALLAQFVSDIAAQYNGSFKATSDKLKALLKKRLISEEELKGVRSKLAENLDVQHIVDEHDTSKEKMQTLKTLFEEELITADQFEKYKSSILDSI